MEGKGKGGEREGREEREEKGKGGGKGPSPPPRKKILAPPLSSYCNMYIFADDAKFYRHIEHPEDQNFFAISNQCISGQRNGC